MSVKKEASGRRSVQVEVEVPGTPEEVWQAIATGPGVSSWFVPTEVRDDGTVVSHFGPGHGFGGHQNRLGSAPSVRRRKRVAWGPTPRRWPLSGPWRLAPAALVSCA